MFGSPTIAQLEDPDYQPGLVGMKKLDDARARVAGLPPMRRVRIAPACRRRHGAAPWRSLARSSAPSRLASTRRCGSHSVPPRRGRRRPATDRHRTEPAQRAATRGGDPPERRRYLPAGDLPDPLTLTSVGGADHHGQPFADFAVAAGAGVWVSGVAPGVVRYDAPSGAITARAESAGEVTQALEATRTEVLVPSLYPSALFRLDATTGAVLARVQLPASPVVEGVVGAADDTGYVLVGPQRAEHRRGRGRRGRRRARPPPTAPSASGRATAHCGCRPATRHRRALRPRGRRVDAASPVGPQPRFLDVGFGAVWVMNQGDGSITRVDARSGEAETIAVTGSASAAATSRSAAAPSGCAPTSPVVRIDPRPAR